MSRETLDIYDARAADYEAKNERLYERAEAEGDLGAKAASLEEERKSRQVEIDELMEKYKGTEDVQARRDLEDQIALKSREMKD